MFLKTPDAFPGGQFYIFGDESADNSYLQSIIEFTRPDARCTGFVSDIQAAGELPVICREPNALSIQKGLSPSIAGNWYSMPVSHGDLWSYWEIGKQLLPALEIDQHTGSPIIARDSFLRFLAAYRPGNFVLANDTLTWNHRAYLSDANYRERQPEIIDFILRRLADWHSRRVFLTIISEPATAVWDLFFSTLFAKVQYMNYVSLHPGDVIINAGIHKGSEIPFLLNGIQGEGQLHNVDPLGFDFLSPYAAEYCRLHQESVFLHEIALAAYDGTIELPIGGEHDQALGGMAGQQLKGFESRRFPCLKLSTLIEQLDLRRIDLLKFDLEGAETSILDDVIQVSRKYRPQLAVSIYHSLTDYIEIPKRLMSELHCYNFYIEHYSFERYETVLYCIPSESDATNGREIHIDLPLV